jgi:hypothetical protein
MSDDESNERPPLGTVEEWSGGFTWIADPDEQAQRASHALATDAGVWLVDPVDAAGLDDRLSALGAVAGVVVLQDRHTRDATPVARRHDVSVLMPAWMELGRNKLETTAEPVGDELPGTDYEVYRLRKTDRWEEAILVNEAAGTILVPETVGTLPSFRAAGDGLGVHPVIDEPPARPTNCDPERVLVGHGRGLHSDGGAALEAALAAE